jgi:hypothetical protein
MDAAERCRHLAGAAGGRTQGNAWPPDEAPHFQRSQAAEAEALDREQLKRAWSAGPRMPSAHAVRYALAPRTDLASHHKGGPLEAEVGLRGELLRRVRR